MMACEKEASKWDKSKSKMAWVRRVIRRGQEDVKPSNKKFKEMMLLVDESNIKAKRLYERLGYKIVGKDTKAKRLKPGKWQLQEIPVTNLCMKKPIGAGGLITPSLSDAFSGLNSFVQGLLQPSPVESSS